MERIVELLPTFVVNAAWQIALVALAASLCARLLSDNPARLRHALWVAALLLSSALPLRGLFDAGEVEPPHARAARLQNFDGATARATNAPALPRASAGDAAPDADDFTLGALVRTRRRAVAHAPWLAYALAAVYALFFLLRARALWGAWQRARLLRRGASCAPPEVERVAARCRAAFGLRDVPVVCSRAAAAPLTLGARAPVVILPQSFAEGMSEESLLSVLGHEMAHVARRDFALNLAYELLLLPVSFHPLVRLVKRQIDRTREVACDELVAGRLLAPDTYARSLVRVAGALAPPAAQALTLGVFDADILEERIMRLTRHARRPGRRAARLLCLAAFSTLCLAGLAASSFSFNLRPDASLSAPTQEPAKESRQEPKERREPERKEPEHAGLQSDAFIRGEIVQALASDNATTRARAACKAGHRHAVDLIPVLAAMLGDDSEIEPFKCWDSGDWSPALTTFKRPSPGEQAAVALASMGGDRRVLEQLIKSMYEGEPVARRNAAWAVGEMTNQRPGQRADAVPRLVALLSDGDAWVRSAAARALGELRDERAADALIGALGDTQTHVRWHAAWALGEMKEERAVEALCNVLTTDAKAEVRNGAADALAEIQNRRAIPALRQALNDPEPSVRESARHALAEIEDRDG